MTFGLPFLSDGIDFAVLAMGIFGVAEILRNLDHTETRDVVHQAIGRLLPNREDFRQSYLPDPARHDIGAILGILPGNGAVLGLRAPTRSRRRSPRIRAASAGARSRAWPGRRAANNAGAQTSFIPLLTLGIPPNAVMALMVGAMTIHGIIPGPQVMTKNPDLFWGMIASMWVGNLMLLDHQPAAGRRMGAPAQGAVPPDVPGDPDVLLHRHLFDQLAPTDVHVHRPVRHRRLHPDQVRLRAGADAARFRARAS